MRREGYILCPDRSSRVNIHKLRIFHTLLFTYPFSHSRRLRLHVQDFLGFSDAPVPLLPSPALIAYLRPRVGARRAFLVLDMVRMPAATLAADMGYGMMLTKAWRSF